MTGVNSPRVWLGATLGTVAWAIWSALVSYVILGERYSRAQAEGIFLANPRYQLFLPIWILTLLLLSYVIAWLHAKVRYGRGASLRVAVTMGFFVGFAAGFPLAFSMATWSPADRAFPFWWMMELWVGAIISSVPAGLLYRDR